MKVVDRITGGGLVYLAGMMDAPTFYHCSKACALRRPRLCSELLGKKHARIALDNPTNPQPTNRMTKQDQTTDPTSNRPTKQQPINQHTHTHTFDSHAQSSGRQGGLACRRTGKQLRDTSSRP